MGGGLDGAGGYFLRIARYAAAAPRMTTTAVP